MTDTASHIFGLYDLFSKCIQQVKPEDIPVLLYKVVTEFDKTGYAASSRFADALVRKGISRMSDIIYVIRFDGEGRIRTVQRG